MHSDTLLQIIQASHFTYLVESEWDERGGIMLVAPPATLKTTFVTQLDLHHDAIVLSDVNISTLVRMRDDIGAGRYRTIVFPEFEKIYQRNIQTASNIEGTIKAFCEEGFRTASFEDARVQTFPARALIVGAITPACARAHWDKWNENGFARRFLWSYYSFSSSVIADAIHQWKKLELSGIQMFALKSKKIPYNLTPSESALCRKAVKFQRGQETPYALLKKIMCVLKHQDALLKQNRAARVIEDFAESLTSKGTILTIKD